MLVNQAPVPSEYMQGNPCSQQDFCVHTNIGLATTGRAPVRVRAKSSGRRSVLFALRSIIRRGEGGAANPQPYALSVTEESDRLRQIFRYAGSTLMKQLGIVVLTFALILGAVSPSLASDDQGAGVGAQIADAFIVRPIGLVVSLATTGIYLATSPLTFLMDTDEQAGDLLVYWPWWCTSGRDLGRFDQPRPL